MSHDIISNVASQDDWDDKDLEERNEALTQAFDADRDANDPRSDEQKDLDNQYINSADGHELMLGQGGESASNFTSSGFVQQEEINAYKNSERDLAVALNTSIYQSENGESTMREGYLRQAEALSAYIDGEKTQEDRLALSLTIATETKAMTEKAQGEYEMLAMASDYVNDWEYSDGHSSAVTSFTAGMSEMGQTVVADALNVLDPDVRSGKEPKYEAEPVEARERAQETKANMINTLLEQGDMSYAEAEKKVNTHIADAKLYAERFEGRATLDSTGELVVKSSFYLMDDASQRATMGSLGLSKHQLREFNSTKAELAEKVLDKYREAAMLMPEADEYFKGLGDGDFDKGVKSYVLRDGLSGTLTGGREKFVARIDDWISGATHLVGAKETGDKYTKIAAARRLLSGQMGGNALIADIIGVAPDLLTSATGARAASGLADLTKVSATAGKVAKSMSATNSKVGKFLLPKGRQSLQVYGASAGAGAGVGLGVFGEARTKGKGVFDSLLLAGEGAAITTAITAIGGASGFEALLAGKTGTNAIKQKLIADTTWKQAIQLRIQQASTLARGVASHGGKEAIEEKTDEWLQSLIVSKQMYPDVSLKDHAEVSWHAAKIGAVIGGVSGSVSASVDTANFTKEFNKVRNQQTLSKIAKDRGIAEEVKQTVNQLSQSSSPLTSEALQTRVFEEAKKQNDEREAEIEKKLETPKLIKRITDKLGDVAAGKLGQSTLKDDAVGRQTARLMQSLEVAKTTEKAYAMNPTAENAARYSAAKLNLDTQEAVLARVNGSPTTVERKPGSTSTSDTTVEDKAGEEVDSDKVLREFKQVPPAPINERKVADERSKQDEIDAADTAIDQEVGDKQQTKQESERVSTKNTLPKRPGSRLKVTKKNVDKLEPTTTPQVGETRTVYKSDGTPVEVSVTAVSNTGQYRGDTQSGENILASGIEYFAQNPTTEDRAIASSDISKTEKFQGKKLSELSDADLATVDNVLTDRIAERAGAKEAADYDNKADLTAIKAEIARRSSATTQDANRSGLRTKVTEKAENQEPATKTPFSTLSNADEAAEAVINIKRESYDTDEGHNEALREGYQGLVNKIAPKASLEVEIVSDDNADASYNPTFDDNKVLTGAKIKINKDFNTRIEQRFAALQTNVSNGNTDSEVKALRKLATKMVIDEEIRHHAAVKSIGYDGLVVTGDKILANEGALAIASQYSGGKLLTKNTGDYTPQDKIKIAAEVLNILGQRIAHGQSTADLEQAMRATGADSKSVATLMDDLKVYLKKIVEAVKRGAAKVTPELKQQVDRIETFLKTDFGYGEDVVVPHKLTRYEKAIKEANAWLDMAHTEASGNIKLESALNQRITDMTNDHVIDVLSRSNDFVRSVRRDGVDVTQGFYRFNEATMRLEVAVDDSFDGYGETRYGYIMPSRATIDSMLSEFNKRNNISELNAKWQASVKHEESAEEQQRKHESLKRAIRANLNLVVSKPSMSDLLKKRLVPVRDDQGLKRSAIEIFNDREAVTLAGELDIREERTFYQRNELMPKIGRSTRSHARLAALLDFYDGRFAPEKLGQIKYFNEVDIKPNTAILLDARATYEFLLKKHLPGATKAMFNVLPLGIIRSTPDIKQIIQLRDLLRKNNWLGADSNTAFTLPPKAKARWEAEYVGRSRTDIGSSLLLLNGKTNEDGTITLDLLPPDYLTDEQVKQYDKTRASNIIYTTSVAAARRMAQGINNGAIDVRVYDRIKMGDAAAALFIGTDFEVGYDGHPLIKRIAQSFVNNTGRPKLTNDDGSNKPIPMPQFDLKSWGDINMDWLNATIGFMTAVEKQLSLDTVDATMHPTLTYAPYLKKEMQVLKDMALKQLKQHKRSKDYKPGTSPEFYSVDHTKQVNAKWNSMLNRLRDLNDLIYETGLQVRNNTTLQADNFIDFDILNEIESFDGNIATMTSVELLEMLDEMNASDPVFTESYNKEGKRRLDMEDKQDFDQNDDIIARLKEFGWNGNRSVDEQNKKLRSVMMVALLGGNIAEARAFSAQHKTKESLDAALFEMLEDGLNSVGGSMSTNKVLVLKTILGAVDSKNTEGLHGKQDTAAVEHVIDHLRTLPSNKMVIMESRNGLASATPGMQDGVMRPTDILVREVGKQLADVPMIYYDGSGLDSSVTYSGTYVLMDADNNITGLLVDSTDEAKYKGQYDDGVAKVAKQIMKHSLATQLDESTANDIQIIQDHIDEVSTRPEHSDTYKLLKKRLGQSIAELPPVEFILAVMTDTAVQEAVHKLNTSFDTKLSVAGNSTVEQLTTEFLETSFYYGDGDSVTDGDIVDETVDLRSVDTSRPSLSSFGSMSHAFDAFEADKTNNYKNSSIMRQVVKAAFTVTAPKTTEDTSLAVDNYNNLFSKRNDKALEQGVTTLKDFIYKGKEREKRFVQYKDSLNTPFRANNLKPTANSKPNIEAKTLETLEDKWQAVNGKGDWQTNELINSVDTDYAENVVMAYEQKVEVQLKVKLNRIDADIARYKKALDAYYDAKDNGETIPAIIESKSQEFIALREQAFRDRSALQQTLDDNSEVDAVYKKAAIDHYQKRMAAHRQQVRKDKRSLLAPVTSITNFDLKDSAMGVEKLRKLMKLSGEAYESSSAEFTSTISFETALNTQEDANTPAVITQPITALAAPGATVSTVKAGTKLQLYVLNHVYNNDKFFSEAYNKSPDNPIVVNYTGLIASMAQTYADPRSSEKLKREAQQVLEMAMKGRHQGVYNMGSAVMAHSISEDAAKTMVGGVYTKFRKRLWNHQRSVIDTVLSKDHIANAYGHDIFARMDYGLRGNDGRNAHKRRYIQLKEQLIPLENAIRKRGATEAYVASQISSISLESKLSIRKQIERNIQALLKGLEVNESFVSDMGSLRAHGKVANELKAQSAPARKMIQKAEKLLLTMPDDFSIASFDMKMLQGLSAKQKEFITVVRDFTAEMLPSLRLIRKLDGKKDMGSFENYMPWRQFDVDNPQGPDVGVDDISNDEVMDVSSRFAGRRFTGEQTAGLDLNPMRAVLSYANNVLYQTNTKFVNEHFAHVFGDADHDSQFNKVVAQYATDGKQRARLEMLNEVMAEEVKTLINNDLTTTRHDNWVFRGTDFLATTGFRVSLTSIEQPVLQTLPVLTAYTARDPGKAGKVAEVLSKLMVTTPINAVDNLTGGDNDTYAHHVSELIKYAAPELHAREVNGINEMKDIIEKVRLSDVDGVVDKFATLPRSAMSLLDSSYDMWLKASTAAPDSFLIRAIWAANYEFETGKKIDKNSIANLDIIAAHNATNTAEGEMALSDKSKKSRLFQQTENGIMELARRSLIVFSNHLMSIAPNVRAGIHMMRSDDAVMRAEGKKRVVDFLLQQSVFNVAKFKNVAFGVAWATTRGIDDEDERNEAFLKRQESILGFGHEYLGFQKRDPMSESAYIWSVGVKSALEMTGGITPWMSVAQISSMVTDVIKHVAKDVYNEKAPGMGDRYMQGLEGWLQLMGAPGFALSSMMHTEAAHRTAEYDYEFNLDHLLLMYLTFGGNREMRQRVMDKVRDNTGASEWQRKYGKEIERGFYDKTPSNWKLHKEQFSPHDYKHDKITPEEWSNAEWKADKSYEMEEMTWLNREGARYIDGDSGVMSDGFLSKFYPRMNGLDSLETSDNTKTSNLRLREQAHRYQMTKREAMELGHKSAHFTYMNLRNNKLVVAHKNRKVHGGRRTYAYILINKNGKLYDMGALALQRGLSVPTKTATDRYRKLSEIAKKKKLGIYANSGN